MPTSFLDSLTRFFRSDSAGAPSAHRADGSAAVLPGGLASAGWYNPLTGLGQVGVDPAVGAGFQGYRIPTPPEIDRLWTHDWLAARIIEKMPSTCLVRGFRVRGEEDGGAAILRDFEVLNSTDRFPHGAFQAATDTGRGHGGAVMLIGYRKGQPHEPLLESQRTSGIAFVDVFAQHELDVLERWDAPEDASRPDFGMPKLYRVIAGSSAGFPHPRTGQVFHASRALRFAGRALRVPYTAAAPSGSALGFPETGVSVLVAVLNDVARYGLAWSAVSNMLQDASIGVLTMAGLVDALASDDHALIEQRMRLLQRNKGTHRMVFLDADNSETYTRTEVKLTDVPAVLEKVLVSVAGAADCPARILFSTSPSGLNAQTGSEGDLTHFYASCEDYQRRYLGPKLGALLSAVAGRTVEIEWPSLWEASDNEKAQTRLQIANANKVYYDMGFSAAQIQRASAKGTTVEFLGEAPEDTRDEVASTGAPDPSQAPPEGAPGKREAAKIASKQRRSEDGEDTDATTPPVAAE